MKTNMMKYFLTLLLIFSLLIAGGKTVLSGEGARIYFYNPETNINNFASLKTAFDTYLVEQGGYRFQPFNDKGNFEAVLKEGKGNVYLLSSWHLSALQEQKVPLEIALVGTSKGNTFQRKVLTAKKEITNLAMLKNATIAGAGNEKYIYSVLQQIFGKDQALLKDIKILTVPKDIDAVMAVGFGAATAAVASESSLEKLAGINQNQYEQLHSLGFSEKSYLLVAATLKKPENQESQVLDVLNKMADNSEGEKSLKLLGIDGWKPPL
jgi:ABC-type amino acid transport substrate-binding protein